MNPESTFSSNPRIQVVNARMLEENFVFFSIPINLLPDDVFRTSYFDRHDK